MTYYHQSRVTTYLGAGKGAARLLHMNSTPSSETSVYFDAPILHMSSISPTTEGVPALSVVTPPVPDAHQKPDFAAEAHAALAAKEASPESEPISEPPAAATLSDPPASTSPVPQTDAELAESRDVVDPNGISEPKASPPSTLSPHGHGRAASLGYAPSIGNRSVFTNADGQTIGGSTFINGAGTTGPNATAEHNEGLHQRAASADATLSEQQKSRIAKNGAKGNKQLAKIIKTEAKVEKKALTVALKELASLQKIQKTAVKREAKAQSVYTKTLTTFQKHEAAFLAARTKYESSQSQLTSNTEALEISRNNAKEATAGMQDKSQEVDGLRTMFDVDEKEREVKLVELTGKPSTSSRWSILG
ncbi:hypothetical protein B0H16DRAFT_148897 [Mycena metata]|uniref:DNA binding protein Ncp1 n=1 Tax=Mycena metata TaxID=1033252 RepID=A0AAD7K105_9AGAR|nr:hypothetical protein B0H16DRAFT_148897 [Mycena metata]